MKIHRASILLGFTIFASVALLLGATYTANVYVPPGVIVMWSGASTNIPVGWALCDGSNGTPDMRDKFIRMVASGENPGVTGGANSQSYTPAGTVGTPTFSGNAATLTHTGAVITNATTGITIADHTMSGSTASESSHTHGVGSYAVNEPTFTITGTKFTTSGSGTASATAFNGATIGNGSTSVTNPVQTVSGTSAAGSSHSHGAGTLAASSHSITDAGHGHGFKEPSDHSYTPAGTVSTPSFTGTGATITTEPAYYKLCFIEKL